jgi:hypothetical protein
MAMIEIAISRSARAILVIVRCLLERTLFVSQHRGAGGIAHLHPAPSAPGAIGKIPALGHNPFEPEFAHMLEDDRAVAL